MSLTTTKTVNQISLKGASQIDGEDIVSLSIDVTSAGSYSTLSQRILDFAKYTDNKDEVRKDILDFQDEIFKAQDELSKVETATNTAEADSAATEK